MIKRLLGVLLLGAGLLLGQEGTPNPPQISGPPVTGGGDGVGGASALTTNNKVPVVSAIDGTLAEGPMSCDLATDNCTIPFMVLGPKTIGVGASQLPAAAACSGCITTVTDAATVADCTVGSGSAVALCRSNGSTWATLGGGGGDVQGASSLTTNNKLVEVSTTDGRVQEVSNQTANYVYAGPTTGAAAAPTFRAAVASDMPVRTDYIQFNTAVCQNTTASIAFSTPTTNAPPAECVTGTNSQYGVLSFDADTDESVQTHVSLPPGQTGAIDLLFKWRAAATTGNVVWGVQTICIADAETGDPAFNTASTVIDAAKGTTLQWNDATITGVTATGCAADEEMLVRLYRDANDGTNDTMTGDAQLAMVRFTVRRTY